MNAIVAGARTLSDTLSTALRLAAPSERNRSSVCRWWVNHTPSRVPVPTWSSRRSRSCTCRDACARLREARRRRKWKRLLNQAVMPARARRGCPVTRSPIASTIETTNPNGTSQSSVPTRVRREEHAHPAARDARRRRAGRSARAPRPPRGARHARRARPAPRAPASRARQQRSRSSAPGNVAGSNPPSAVKRSTRTSIVALVT